MPYIGRDLNRGNYLKLDDISSSFNSSTKTFNLTVGGSAFTPGSAFSILVSVGGVIQEPESAYQVNNSEITFANAPTAQDGFFCIALGVPLGIGVPGNGTVNGTQIAKPFNYDGFFYLNDASNRVGINSSIPTSALDVSGTIKASTFSGPVVGNTNNTSGISTFYDLRVSNNLTVEGTTTTLDTNLVGVDRVEVGANSNTVVGVAITQSGTADILRLYDGASQVVTVDDTGNVGIGSAIPAAPLDVSGRAQIGGTNDIVGTPYSYFYGRGNGGDGVSVYAAEPSLELVGLNGGSHAASLLFRTAANDGIGFNYNPGGNTLELKSFDATGNNFQIHASGSNVSNLKNILRAVSGGTVELYHNNNRKIFTTSTGVQISCDPDGDGLKFEGTTRRIDIVANTNRGGAVNTILELDAHWNNTSVAFIALATGDDTTNKDDGRIRFFTKPSGGTIAERLRIESDGKVGIGSDSPRTELDVNGDVTVGSGGENSALGVRVNSAYAQIKLPDGQTGADRKGNLSFGDNDDFRIVHDGYHNYITAGAGDIYVSTSSANPVNIRNSRIDVNVDLTLTDTATDSAAGPEFKLFRNSASPADADYLGQIKFAGESDTGVERNYAKITGKILDASNGTEDGILEFAHIKAGSQTITGRWRSDSLQLLNGTSLTVAGTLDVTGVITAENHVKVTDSGRLLLGTSSDLQLFHNGSGSFIDAYTNDLQIRNDGTELLAEFKRNLSVDLYYDGTKRFETKTNGAQVNGSTFFIRGGTGEDSVLQFISNNSASYNDHYNFRVAATGAFSLQTEVNANNYENILTATQNGAVELYHNNVKKFETTSSGNKATGKLGLDDGTGSSGNYISLGQSDDLKIYHDGSNNYIEGNNQKTIIRNTSNNIHIQAKSGEAGIDVLPDSYVKLYHDGSERFVTTSSGVTVTGNLTVTDDIYLSDANVAYFGTNNDMRIYHSGTHGYVKNTVGNLYFMTTNSEYGALLYANGGAELRYDNVKKFETTSSGVSVNGDLNFGNSASYDIQLQGGKIYGDDSALPAFTIQNTSGNANHSKIVIGDNYGSDNGGITFYGAGSSTTDVKLRIRGTTDTIEIPDNHKLNFGAGNDLQIYSTGARAYIDHVTGGTGSDLWLRTKTFVVSNYSNDEYMIVGNENGGVLLYHNNTKTFETTASGAKVYGGSTNSNGQLDIQSRGTAVYSTLSFKNSSGGGEASIGTHSGADTIYYVCPNHLFHIGGAYKLQMTGSTMQPYSGATFDLGSSSNRFDNVYTNDLNLSNEGKTNDVDGTWGSYTIQEGEDDLFLINKRSGKKYKFNLTEVS